jgi:hypothetical protein
MSVRCVSVYWTGRFKRRKKREKEIKMGCCFSYKPKVDDSYNCDECNQPLLGKIFIIETQGYNEDKIVCSKKCRDRALKYS